MNVVGPYEDGEDGIVDDVAPGCVVRHVVTGAYDGRTVRVGWPWCELVLRDAGGVRVRDDDRAAVVRYARGRRGRC